MSGWAVWAADALVGLAVLVMTLGVLGVARMPGIYARLHAATVVGFLGNLMLLAAASLIAPDAATVHRSLLIAAFLVLTTPVASHAIARSAYLREGTEERRLEIERRSHLSLAERRPPLARRRSGTRR